tara:strand:- start:5923 stop:6318 length:396 start_codon:yes stop_codon:yes gene_type:complete
MLEKKISRKKLREFGYLIGIGIPFLIGTIFPLISGHNIRIWTFVFGIIFIFFAAIKPNILFYPYLAWMKLGFLLGWINSKLILGLIFFLVLQPIALIMKLFGYDPLRLKKSNKKSYKEYRKIILIDLKKIF